MGGDSFPNTERLSEEEYQRTCEVISVCLREQHGLEHRIPVEVRDKAEICRQRGKEKPYGDVDIIVGVSAGDNTDRLGVVQAVIAAVNGDSNEIHKNDSTFSFLTCERYQVDIKFCERENLAFLAAFKSNNDFGALLGHLLSPLKLKWSEKGLMLKLKIENVSGVGSLKADFLLTRDLAQVCDMLGLPPHSLDGRSSLSCREIFKILTNCSAFFPGDYDEKYKIRERRKKRPVSDTFFNLLEASDTHQLGEEKMKMFEDNKVENIFRKFRHEDLDYSDYILEIAEVFGAEEDLQRKLADMKTRLNESSVHPKFNYRTLVDWYPDVQPNTLGRLLGKMKSKHSGNGRDSFTEWIESTSLQEIRKEAETVRVEIQIKV